ncbi:MAG: molecular chaperone TorD family protein [Longimicrobiales bacterium]|nr:molecular chaperone TorD family protein [Longimicrobiales bacterium]
MPARPESGARYRAPPVEAIRGLAVLAEPPTPEHRAVARSLGLDGPPSPAHYSDLFLFQLYPYASVHLGAEGMMGGQAAARVAGFWRALGYEPPPEPDHLAALLGLYAALCAREAGESVNAEARLLRRSRFVLLHEHLAPWIFPFLERLRELTDGPFHPWSRILESVLRRELEEGGEDDVDLEVLPAHLREAPPLADPRREGATDFLDGLLAPVRSGVLLLRADLARIAQDRELGLRAGERRYALEHLLSQDAPGVLQALAEEARRQALRHRRRCGWLGVTARFLGSRAHATVTLLGELADEESRDGAEGRTGVGASGKGGGS